ncbi:MAG: hypothetical protein ACYDAV_05785 [Gammaproteobacteria bacterium]
MLILGNTRIPSNFDNAANFAKTGCLPAIIGTPQRPPWIDYLNRLAVA